MDLARFQRDWVRRSFAPGVRVSALSVGQGPGQDGVVRVDLRRGAAAGLQALRPPHRGRHRLVVDGTEPNPARFITDERRPITSRPAPVSGPSRPTPSVEWGCRGSRRSSATSRQAGLSGRASFVESTTTMASSQYSAPREDWRPHRVGTAAPASGTGQRESLRFMHSTLSPAPGGSVREGWRLALALSVQPVVELVQGHLREALGVPDLTLDMRRARAAYVTMLSRAVGSLVNAKPDPANGGMTIDQARELVGL